MHRIQISTFLFIIATAGLLAFSCSSDQAAEPGRFYSRADGFSVKFHTGWEVTEGDGVETAMVEATSPWEDDNDEFSEHITIDLEDLDREPDLEVYFAELVEDQGNYLPEFRASETGSATIDGVDARWFKFEFTSDGYPMKAIGYAFINDKRAYLIAGIAQAHQFMFYEGVFEETAKKLPLRVDFVILRASTTYRLLSLHPSADSPKMTICETDCAGSMEGGIDMRVRCGPIAGLFLGLVVLATAASASVEDQLSVYGEENARGYLKPLMEAAGTDLNLGLFESAYIPTEGWFIKLELRGMGTWFKDDEKTFNATTEDGFSPQTTVEAPTVIGPGDAVRVESDTGTEFFFPGGFDLGSFALAAPQIRFGQVKGTEGLVRFVAAVLGDNELGDLQLWGVGVRHSISQYLDPDLGYNIAAGFMYSNFKAGTNEGGNDMFDVTAWTLGAEGSKIWRKGGAAIEPYVGLSVDSYSASVEYQSEAGTPSVVDVKYDASYGFRASLGLLASVQFVAGQLEYNLGTRNSITFSLGFGKY